MITKNFNLVLTNTLLGKKEEFVPISSPNVTMYVCGITPYDFPHVGHGRVYVTFDVLFRLLTFLGYKVTYCRNFTDIDDKLLQRAEKELGGQEHYHAVAQKFIAAFKQNMQQLACITPNYEPLVTECIPEIIAFVQGLIDAGKAYVVDGDVYFHVRSFADYGKLSKRNIDDLKAGARVDIDERKRDPLDFALWKSEPVGTFWQSPWGWGRPGWHIECSAMASKFLSNHIDIHAGGMDLIFPHHENEVAQSEGLHGAPFAKYWMHNAFVRINKEKMSKSLGNFFTLNDIFEQFDPMVVRFYYLNHSYTGPLDFSFEELERIQKTYQRLCKIFELYDATHITKEDVLLSPIGNAIVKFLCDDLNTVGAFGVIFEHIKEIENNIQTAGIVKALLQQLFGLALQPLPEKETVITPEIERLLAEREAARAAKDWAKADALRMQLQELGFEVQDKKKA